MAGQDEHTYGFSKADAQDIVQLIGGDDHEYLEGKARGSSNSTKLFLTPGGGIAARSGATLGSATCTMLSIAGGTRSTTSTSFTVYNDFLTAITGSVDIIATKVDGVWVVFAEDCT